MNNQEIDWKTCHEKLTVLQAKLVEAHRAKDARRIKDLQRNIVTSFESTGSEKGNLQQRR
jgi:hypothetical protein